METKTNWLAIAAAVVASLVVGFLWYGPLFGATWMAGNGITMEGEKPFKNGVEMSMSLTPMWVNIAVMIVFVLLMNWLLRRTGSTTWAAGAKVGAVVGLFMALNIGVGILFASRPAGLILVDGFYPLAQLTLMGAIVGGWRKK